MPAIPYISSATPTSNFIYISWHTPLLPSPTPLHPPHSLSMLQLKSLYNFRPNVFILVVHHLHILFFPQPHARPGYNDHSHAHLPAIFPSRSHRSSSVSLTVRPLFNSLISPAHWQSPHPNPFYNSLHPCPHRLLYLERSPITLVSAPFIFLAPPLTILRNLPLCTS